MKACLQLQPEFCSRENVLLTTKCLLACLDILSYYAWNGPIMNKIPREIVYAFYRIISKGRKVKIL